MAPLSAILKLQHVVDGRLDIEAYLPFAGTITPREKGHHAQAGDGRPRDGDRLKRAVGILMGGQIRQAAIDHAVEFLAILFAHGQTERSLGLRPLGLDGLAERPKEVSDPNKKARPSAQATRPPATPTGDRPRVARHPNSACPPTLLPGAVRFQHTGRARREIQARRAGAGAGEKTRDASRQW